MKKCKFMKNLLLTTSVISLLSLAQPAMASAPVTDEHGTGGHVVDGHGAGDHVAEHSTDEHAKPAPAIVIPNSVLYGFNAIDFKISQDSEHHVFLDVPKPDAGFDKIQINNQQLIQNIVDAYNSYEKDLIIYSASKMAIKTAQKNIEDAIGPSDMSSGMTKALAEMATVLKLAAEPSSNIPAEELESAYALYEDTAHYINTVQKGILPEFKEINEPKPAPAPENTDEHNTDEHSGDGHGAMDGEHAGDGEHTSGESGGTAGGESGGAAVGGGTGTGGGAAAGGGTGTGGGAPGGTGTGTSGGAPGGTGTGTSGGAPGGTGTGTGGTGTGTGGGTGTSGDAATTRKRSLRVVVTPLTALNAAKTALQTAATSLKHIIDTATSTKAQYLSAKKAYLAAVASVNDLKTFTNPHMRPAPKLGLVAKQTLYDMNLINYQLMERRLNNKFGLWLDGQLPKGETDYKTDINEKMSTKNTHYTIGMDHRVDARSINGAFVSWSKSKGQTKGNGIKQDKDAVSFGFYQKYDMFDGSYIASSVAFNKGTFKNTITRLNEKSKSQITLKAVSNDISFGVHIGANSNLEAYVNNTYILKSDTKETEITGTGIFNSTSKIDAKNFTTVGGRYYYVKPDSILSSVTLKPYIKGFYEQIVSNGDLMGSYTQLSIHTDKAIFEQMTKKHYGLQVGAIVYLSPGCISTIGYNFNNYGDKEQSLALGLNFKL